MKQRLFKYCLFLLTAALVFSCSTKKNTGLSRGFHNLTSRYNILFNGWESFEKGMDKLEKSKVDNYSEVLPIFIYQKKDEVAAITSEMDRSIAKATKIISNHSITAKPELDEDKDITPKQREFYNQAEFNKWVDEAYLLMAKAHFYKHEFNQAAETFHYVVSNFPNSEAELESGIWLARISIERNRLKEAENTLFELTNDKELPKRLLSDYEATLAHLEMKKLTLNYGEEFFTLSAEPNTTSGVEKVIQHLSKALDAKNSKYYRQRYNFIIAQLLQQNNEGALASEYYRKVIKMNPPYEMTFNARINMALSYEAGSVSRREIEKELNKMIRDDKNIEYQDQIYYAWGNLYFKEGDLKTAVDYYILSASVSQGNILQQARSYLTIADISYDKPDYIFAQAYYDSTVQIIDAGYPNYNQIYAKSISLSNLVNNIHVVELQDSVQKLSYLPQPELYAFIDDIIEAERQREEEEREQERQRQLNDAFNTQQKYELQTSSSSWYFYNPTAVNLGRQEFRKGWGVRQLEDDWRRKNKNSVDLGGSFADETEQVDPDNPSVSQQKLASKFTRDYYLVDIPFTDSAMDASHSQIMNSLNTIGEIYYQELKDYEKAIVAYEDLLSRYPTYENRLSVYYKLYTIGRETENIAMVSKYQQKITNEFPESNYALVLSDPNYFKKIEEQKQKHDALYVQIYNSFDRGEYAKASSLIHRALGQNPETEYAMQYDYMLTVSEGIQKDTVLFISDLEKIVSKYPGSEISERSQQLISYLKTTNPEAARKQEIKQAVALYTEAPDATHYVVIVLPKANNVNQLMFNIINFNIDSFSEEDLKVKKSDMDNLSLLQVTSFKDQKQANNYYQQLNRYSELYRDVDASGSFLFYISDGNLKLLQRDKKLGQYRTFFEQNLLK